MKFGYNGPSSFREKAFEIVDGGTTKPAYIYISSPGELKSPILVCPWQFCVQSLCKRKTSSRCTYNW